MSEFYTGIDIGTDSVKIIVAEKRNENFHVLGSTCSTSHGIKNGQIVDTKLAVSSVKNAIKQVENMLDIKIKKVVAAVPPTNCKMDIVMGTINVLNPTCITGIDVSAVLNEAVKGHKYDGYEIVTVSPISFIVDDKENIKDPKGMVGDTLEAKVVISSIPKDGLYKILEVIYLAGLDTVDIAFTSTGDYYATKGSGVDSYVGAVINIGESSTNVSIFNKGIQIKHSLLPVGSTNVDKDLSYIYNISLDDARSIKENFAFALEEYSDESEKIFVITNDKDKKELSQVSISKVVEARLLEILKLSKNEIKNLTNREIRYIIVAGGLSELQGFHLLIDREFHGLAKVCKISTIGIRHNKYSSAFGVIKYFDEKLSLRERNYDMIDKDNQEILTSTENKLSDYDTFSKVYGHLFD